MEISDVADIFAAARFNFGNEEQLQLGLTEALRAAGHAVEREVRLDGQNRIDLLVGTIGVEVKVAGKPDDVLAQVTRYCHSDLIEGLVLVTTRMRHRLPAEINHKPVRVVSLGASRL